MKKYRIKKINLNKLLLCTIGLLLIIVPLDAQTEQSFKSNGTLISDVNFDAEINTMRNRIGIPGVSIAIIEDNKVVYSQQYGWSHLEKKKPVDNETLFEAASITKMFLVYVVNRLVDQGNMDLDTPVHQYLDYPELSYDDRYKSLTTRMLLSHTAGLENWTTENDPEKLEFVANPGSGFTYSGEAYHYLAEVVSTILGSSYEDYVEEMILKPYHLNNTYLNYGGGLFGNRVKNHHAMGYTSYRKEFEGLQNKESIPASGSHTNAKDVAQLIIHTFSGAHLSEKQQQKMLASETQLTFIPDTDELKFGVGLGVFLIKSEEDTITFFSGVNTGFRSEFFYSPITKRGFVYMSNSDEGWMMISKIDELTTQFNLRRVFKDDAFLQYPSPYFELRNIYSTEGGEKFISSVTPNNSNNIDPEVIDLLKGWLEQVDELTFNNLLKLYSNK